MPKSKKYYVVWEGQRPGIYDSWDQCKLQISGYPNAKYKAFKSLQEAKDAYHSSFEDHFQQKTTKLLEDPDLKAVIKPSISVDAACSGNPGVMEYRGVDTDSGDEIFRQGPFEQGTNNIGEFLAIVHALAYLQKCNDLTTPIYTDSRTALAWIRNKQVKTNLKRSRKSSRLFHLVDRAIRWLKINKYENPILKWETKKWGEIPADFGRK